MGRWECAGGGWRGFVNCDNAAAAADEDDDKCGLCDKNGEGVKVRGERGLLIGVMTGNGGLGGIGDNDGNGGAEKP